MACGKVIDGVRVYDCDTSTLGNLGASCDGSCKAKLLPLDRWPRARQLLARIRKESGK